jgi:hypothetical protein
MIESTLDVERVTLTHIVQHSPAVKLPVIDFSGQM